MKLKISILLLCFVFLSSCLSKQVVVPSPESFSDVSRDMKTPYFWISKIKNPNRIILSKKEIDEFNKITIENNRHIKDIFNLDLNKEDVFTKKKSSQIVRKYGSYYNSSLNRAGKKYINSILNSIDYNCSYSNETFAITTKIADLRILPVKEPLYSSLTSTNLDRLQETQLDFASPLIVLYSTLDKNWYYVISEISDGWITADSIAFGSKKNIETYKKKQNFVIVISKQADLYNSSNMSDFYDNVRMGSILPCSRIVANIVEVEVPVTKTNGELSFKKVFVKKADISLGFLPYTQSSVINQAFKYLDIPYGWGDDSGYPDCSSFVRQIFSCFGIVFPRNSKAQSQIGNIVVNFDDQGTNEQKTETILQKAIPGITITIFYLLGHIMLYLGSNDGQPYIIHSLYGYGGKK
ncbi:MAG: SH3 domain-containing protein [Endomicrobium sp.]|jgi:cell wall-associated NlpC family hydrolase|nr:SH3 domain-containing protein [Endomicrobium sp.]